MCMTETNSVVKCKSVLNPVYDIKPKKENPDASIFIFVETEKFVNDFTTILSTSEQMFITLLLEMALQGVFFI